MAGGQTEKCPICEGNLAAGSDVCPRCGTDASVFRSRKEGTKPDPVVKPGSLDDILASVLDEPSDKSVTKAPPESSLDDLDLDLPEAPPTRPKLELNILEEEVLGKEDVGKEESGPVTFECPGCGADVDETASRCPSCGALFAEGDSFPCPVCGSHVPVDATQCPECSVRFEEGLEAAERPSLSLQKAREAYARDEPLAATELQPVSPTLRPGAPDGPTGEAGPVVKAVLGIYSRKRGENPLLVGDVPNLQGSLREQVAAIKSLVSVAHRLRVPIENTQMAIASATKKARARDLSGAVKLAWSARLSLEQSVALQTAHRLEVLEQDLQSRRARGEGFPVAEALVKDGIKELKGGRVVVAFEKLQLAREDMTSKASGQSEAGYAIQAAEEFLDEASELNIDVTRFREYTQRGREALRIGDWETASQLAAGVEDRVTGSLRQGIAEEMKKARQVLMELKMRGHDVTKPINTLKQASACTKEGAYAQAMKYLSLFKRQVGSY